MTEATKSDGGTEAVFGCLGIVAIFGGIIWGVFYWINSSHKLLPIGFTLPEISTFNYLNPSDSLVLTSCKGEFWGNKFTCNLQTKYSYIEEIRFEAFEFSGGKPIKLQDGKVKMPSLSPEQIVKMSINFDNINEVDSLKLWVSK